ncbi:MAG: hypothetical protein RR626_02580 [Anaerovoracaceae bacterium]
MISYETINARLGFDYLKAEKEYFRKHCGTEYDGIEGNPVRLLTIDELKFLVADFERQRDK